MQEKCSKTGVGWNYIRQMRDWWKEEAPPFQVDWSFIVLTGLLLC